MGQAKLPSIAWRNLWRRRRRTLLTLSSIIFGTFLAVMFTAMQDRSFADMIDTAARMGGGHVSVQHHEYLERPSMVRTVGDTESARKLALADPGVSHAVDRIVGQTTLSTARDSFGAVFIAYDPQAETAETFALADGLVEGKMHARADDEGIVLGEKLAKNLGVKMGRKVVYTVTNVEGEIVTGMARLTGIVRTGAPSMDAGLALIPIDTLRQVLGYREHEATQVAIFIHDARRSTAVAERLRAGVPEGSVALSWDEANAELAGFIAMKVGGARFMEIIIGILVAAGIFNTLFVSVMERLREFGIMLAVGFTPRQLFGMVMLESLWLALVGLVAAAAFTAGPYLYLVEKGIDMSAMMGNQATEVAGVGFDPILRVGIFPENMVLIGASVVLATLAAGLYPAWRASSVAPVESIKLV